MTMGKLKRLWNWITDKIVPPVYAAPIPIKPPKSWATPNPTLHGEDAHNLLNQIKEVASPEELAKRKLAAQKFAALVEKPKDWLDWAQDKPAAQEMWATLKTVVPNLRYPTSSGSYEDSVMFIWDDGEKYLDIDIIFGDGRNEIDWFWRNRETNEVGGDEFPYDDAAPLPAALVEKLVLFGEPNE